MNPVRLVSGQEFRRAPHIDRGADHAQLQAGIDARLLRRMQQHRRLELWVWLAFGLSVVAPIVVALLYIGLHP